MKKIIRSVLALAPLLFGAAMAPLAAQEEAPPKILSIYVESVKPGKDILHMKNESAWAQAFAVNKVSAHTLGATSMSGPDEAWFLVGYDSFSDFEKASKETESPKYEPFLEKDGDLISGGQGIIANYKEDWSYQPMTDIGHMRYFEVEIIHVKVGHTRDLEALAKMDVAALAKANVDEHDISFDGGYGGNGHVVFIFTPHKSLSEIDQSDANEKAFLDALGEEGRKRRAELIDASIASTTSQLFEVTPELSYPTDAWIKADPDFWKVKKMAAKASPAPTAEKKPSPPAGAN